jgi:hypothetical protein
MLDIFRGYRSQLNAELEPANNVKAPELQPPPEGVAAQAADTQAPTGVANAPTA